MERRGFSTVTPPWMLMRSRQLLDGAHLSPVLRQARHEVASATTGAYNARASRYQLHLTSTPSKRWVVSSTTTMLVVFGDNDRPREDGNNVVPYCDYHKNGSKPLV